MTVSVKTTIEFPQSFLKEAKHFAKKHELTLKELVMLGLKEIMLKLSTQQPKKLQAKLKAQCVDGQGMTTAAKQGGWKYIRDEIYP